MLDTSLKKNPMLPLSPLWWSWHLVLELIKNIKYVKNYVDGISIDMFSNIVMLENKIKKH